jgi:hypothetical protein
LEAGARGRWGLSCNRAEICVPLLSSLPFLVFPEHTPAPGPVTPALSLDAPSYVAGGSLTSSGSLNQR